MQRIYAAPWPVLTLGLMIAGAGGYVLRAETSTDPAACATRTSMPMLRDSPHQIQDASEDAMRAGASWSRWRSLTDY